MSEATVLPRTGDRPLAFTGEALAFATSQAASGPAETRWWELSLFRTAINAGPDATPSPRWVLQISYKTRWQGELYLDSVIVADTEEQLTTAAKAFDFLKPVKGFPRGQEDKQNRLLDTLTQHWNTALSVILSHLGPEQL